MSAPRRWIVGLGALALVFVAEAAELTPEQVARIQHEQRLALQQIEKAHGGRKPSQMSPDERREVIREQREAMQKVLDAHQVEDKAFARHVARMPPAERAQVARHEDALRKSEEAPRPEAKDSIPVLRGFDEDDPPDDADPSDGGIPIRYGVPEEKP